MNHAVISLLLILAVAVAVRQDLLEHRIPNWLTFGTVASGVAAQSFFGGLAGLVAALAGMGIGLACFLPLYLGRGTGAGDVKLMGAVGTLLGPADGLRAAALALVCGAVLACGLVAWRLIAARRAVVVPAVRQGSAAAVASPATAPLGKTRFPYAIAIALGALGTLWISGTLAAALEYLGLT